ncbi:MAG: hypothetical protein ACN6N0_08430, partial [Microvirgula sp.]
FAAEREFFHRDEMQALATLWIGAPGGPGHQEIEAQPEAGLDDRIAVAPAPGAGEAIAGQIDMVRLFGAAIGGVIDIIEPG